MTRAEKVQAIRAAIEQHPGLTRAQVAGLLGMKTATLLNLLCDPDGSKQAARRRRYQRPCPECGTLMDGSGGFKRSSALCATCAWAKQHDERLWTPETVVDAIQRWARLMGRPPIAPDWLHAGDWEDADGVFRTPAASTVHCHSNGRKEPPFRYWADAIEAAGFPRPLVGRRANNTGATAAIRALVADGGTHTYAELRDVARERSPVSSRSGGAVYYMAKCGELVRVAPGRYQAGPNLRAPRAIPAPSSDSSTAARVAA